MYRNRLASYNRDALNATIFWATIVVHERDTML